MSDRNLSRRSFLKVSALAGGGFMVGACMPASASAKPTAKKNAAPFAPSVWVSVEPNGQVSITVSKVDIGQGVRTSMAMIVADEMDVDWKNVKVVQAQGDSAKYGHQGVGGSGSTMGLWMPLRQAGAAAKAMLVAAAAQSMSVRPEDCLASNSLVQGPASGSSAGRKMTYGELATLAASMPPPAQGELKLKEPSQWKLIGKPMKRVDNPDVVAGKAIYAMDVKVPGALYAMVEMAPAIGARLENLDDTEAKQVKGITHVLRAPWGVAVVGENTYACIKARQALKCTWSAPREPDYSTTKMRAEMKAAIQAWPGEMQGASKTIEAQYELPYLAHACMEPLCATVVPSGDRADVYIGSQSPENPKRAVAQALDIAPENVTVHVTLGGGGFGFKGTAVAAQQAAWVAKQVGKPIKLQWSREDDMKNDAYRPSSHHACRGGLAADGTPVGFDHQMINAGGRGGGGGGGYRQMNTPYRISAQALSGSVGSPVPTGAWRSVGNSQTCFVVESFIDEMAHAAGKDPYQFRLDNMANERVKKCLVAAAEKAGWGKPLPEGHGRGIACFSGWNSNVAHVCEVSVDEKGKVKVHKMVIAADCGTEVNPLTVEAQLEGAAIDGITCALKARITAANGAIVQSNFNDYEWIRLDEAPAIEVVHVPSGANPGGMGELGVPSSAPAVVNAIFAATGKRCRRIPVRPQDLV